MVFAKEDWIAMIVKQWQGARLVLTLGLLLTLPAQAQPEKGLRGNAIPRTLYPPGLRPPVRLSPEEQQTIDRALSDLQSDNQEFRAGAVMILGKYEAGSARDAVIKMLGDRSDRVRRAALVSVVEWSRNAPPNSVEPVLALLADSDIEIRRMASSCIQNMMMIRSISRMSAFGNRAVKPLPQGVKDAIVNAFLDPDTVVRRNMISQYSTIGFQIPNATFIQLLQDSDRQVRLAALPLAARALPLDQFMPMAKALVDDPERTVRLRLIRELFMTGEDESKALLRALGEDEDNEVSSEAQLWIFQLSAEPAVYAGLYQRYETGRLTQAQSSRLIQLTSLLGKEGIPYIMQFLEDDDATLRLEGLRSFLSLQPDETHAERFTQFLNDRSANVRRELIHYFEGNADILTESLIEDILYSPYDDVRLSLLRVLENFSAEKQQDLLLELLLDENIHVRKQTLSRIAFQKIEGWLKIMKASLKDPNTEIQKSAARLLIEVNDPKAAQVLQEYVDKNPQSLLTAFIKKMKKKRRYFRPL